MELKFRLPPVVATKLLSTVAAAPPVGERAEVWPWEMVLAICSWFFNISVFRRVYNQAEVTDNNKCTHTPHSMHLLKFKELLLLKFLLSFKLLSFLQKPPPRSGRNSICVYHKETDTLRKNPNTLAKITPSPDTHMHVYIHTNSKYDVTSITLRFLIIVESHSHTHMHKCNTATKTNQPYGKKKWNCTVLKTVAT